MPMKNPVHPGRIVRHDCLEPLGLSVTEGAKVLGVTRQTLTKILNAKSGISPHMAIRLTKAFGSTPETLAAHATCLRPRHRLERREEHKSAAPARPAGIARKLTCSLLTSSITR
jgi:addiction module HigA family antidote